MLTTIPGRPGTPEDAIDGVVPRSVVEPDSAEAVAEVLAQATRDKLTVVVRGAGTKSTWGPAPKTIGVLLSTAKLNRVVAHRHGDLTATIEAGATLDAVNTALAQHRQWIPLDPSTGGAATIGGLVATNDSGPRRHRYGAPRDLIIGVEFARADGLLAKGGGIVVKNVAGYDLPRLMTGSFGSLAVIVSATFKLYPLTSASATVVADLKSTADLSPLVGQVLASHLTPTALELQTSPPRLLMRFESIAESVQQQSANAAKLASESGFGTSVLSGEQEATLWSEHGQQVWGSAGANGTRVKVSTLPGDLSSTLALVERLAGGSATAAGRAGLGVFLLNVGGDTGLQKRVITGLRDSMKIGRGSAVIVRGSAELKSQVDVWGTVGDGISLMRAVKQQFDPAGVLNPGRAPGGI
jgi:glycolate oxidase FAD binding subunit